MKAWTYQRPPRVNRIIAEEAARHLTKPQEILAGSHERKPVAARRRICARLSKEGMSLNQIGRYLHLHHTSVMYHIRRADPVPFSGFEKFDPDVPDLSGEWAI